GADLYSKLLESNNRIMDLLKIIQKFSPDLVISFSSPEAARISFGLRIDHIGFNDSPHAEAVARLSLPLLTKLFSPSLIPLSSWTKYGISSNDIIQYNGLDPVAWLMPRYNDIYYKKNRYNNNIFDKLKIDRSKRSILIILEESQAAYILNHKLIVEPISLVEALIKHFYTDYNILILCRYSNQIAELSKRFENKAIILNEVVDGIGLLQSVDIFIGAGGTMTAESALLGIPTVSIAPVRFYVDDYLQKIGLIKRSFSISTLLSEVDFFLNNDDNCVLLAKKANKILLEMENPIDKLVTYIKSNYN
ncbi:MAG: DUF354 domain-containing protein, partial [Candidatus Nitrosocosmicus sp.]